MPQEAVKKKTLDEKCLQCGGKKQKLTVFIDDSGIMTEENCTVLKCKKGHYEVKYSKGKLIVYDPGKSYNRIYQ